MPIKIRCPECNASLSFADKLRGKKVRCRSCDDVFVLNPNEDPLDDDDEDEDDEERPARGRRRDEGRRGQSTASNQKPLIFAGVAGGVLLLVVGLVLVVWLMRANKPLPAEPIARVQAPAPPGFNPPAEQPVNIPNFQPPPAAPNPAPAKVDPPKSIPFDPPKAVSFPQGNETPAAKPVDWKVKPDAGPTLPPAKSQTKPVIFGRDQDLVFPATPSSFLAIGNNNSPKSVRQLWNLETMKTTNSLRGNLNLTTPYALSPDGLYFAGLSNNFQATIVDVWSFKTNKGAQRIQLDHQLGHKVETLAFTAPDQLLIGKSDNDSVKFHLFDVTTGKPIRMIEAPKEARHESVAVSGGGKYLAVGTKDKIMIYELATGDAVGEAELPKTEDQTFGHWQCHALSFSPDGVELAGVFENIGANRLISWDLTKGEVLVDHQLGGDLRRGGFRKTQGPSLDWLPERSGWLAFSAYVLDHDSGAVLSQIPAANGDIMNESMRRVLDKDHLLAVLSNFNGKAMQVVKLPREQLDAAVQAARASAKALQLPEPKPADWSTARLLSNGGGVAWSVTPDPAPAAKERPTRKPIPLTGAGSDVERIVFSRADVAQAAVFFAVAPNPLAAQKVNRVDRFDLKNGKHLGGMVLSGIPTNPRFGVHAAADQGLLADFSPDGTCVALRERKEGQRLDVWSVAENKHLVGFLPYAREAAPGNSLAWIGFLDAERVFTLSGAGKLVLWSLPDCKAIYALDHVLKASVALSPGRKYLAALAGNTYGILEAATGECKGETPWNATNVANQGGHALPGGVAFNSGGSELAVALPSPRGGLGVQLARWDLKSGKTTAEFPLAHQVHAVEWCGPRHILTQPFGNFGPALLIDLESKLALARYNAPGMGKHGFGGPDNRHWFASQLGGGVAVLHSQVLPDAEATRFATFAADPNSPALVRPGASVSLRVEVTGATDKDFAQRITATLTARLEAIGLKVAPGQNATLVFQAQMANSGEQHQLQEIIGFKRMTVPVQQVDCKIALVDAQGTAWWQEKNSFKSGVYGIIRANTEAEVSAQLTTQVWTTASTMASGGQIPNLVLRQNDKFLTPPIMLTLTGDR